ncbi:MAG: DUF58 domain-containing protein [Anaerolineales bacterium]|nr:DUF58 domain-containing protein [Anaerolineales bacterium]
MSDPVRTTPEQVLHRLEWQVIRRLDGLLQGDYRTLLYGHGIDFADLREYQPQDDVRHMDWNVTARLDAPHVRQYVEDREVTAWFLLDMSPSMNFGPLERPKQAILIDLVTSLARLLSRSGNRVGAILYNNRVAQVIPPHTGRNQVLRLTRAMLDSREAPAGATTDLGILLHAALNTFRRRSLVFLISDFLSEPGWEKPLALLRQRHELVAVRLWDPGEVDLPDVGFVVVEDAETGEQLFVDTGNPTFRRRFHEAADRREAALKTALTRAGVDLYGVATDDDVVAAIVRMANLRKKRRQ